MKSCSRKILDLFYNAKHAGKIVKPDAIGRVGGQDDGLVIELSWRIVNDTIIDAKFRAFGNPNAIAITSLMTDYFIGKTLEEVMNIDESIITDELDELKPEYLEVYEIVCSAMEEAYQYYLKHKDKHATSEAGEIDLDTINTVEVEQELSQEEVERRIQLNIQRELSGGVKSGRGRPRKELAEGEEVEAGEKRGRGRPRKEHTPEELEALALAATEKRGRGRPKKERTPEELEALALASTEKRGRGRPKKERSEEELAKMQEKSTRGRGRPKKERTPEELEALALASSEKRGRGRPRKERIEIEVIGEKRGRGRPRKEIDLDAIEEKRGRGRPRKAEPVRINFPKSDLDEIITDEVVEQLISGSSADKTIKETSIEENINSFANQYASNVTQVEDDIEPRAIESNVRNDEAVEIEPSQNNMVENYALEENNEAYQSEVYEEFEEKRGRGRPRKERIQIEVIGEKRGRGRPRKEVEEEIEVGEKRGRGRPRKELSEAELEALAATEKRGRGRPRKEVHEDTEMVEGEKRGRGRPRKEVDLEQTADVTEEKRGRGRPRKEENISMVSPINSLTRSLTTNGMPSYHKTQDIVFASKNVTTTNININVVKTTNSNGEANNEYSKNINVVSTTEDAAISNSAYMNLNQQSVEQTDDELETENINQDLNTNEKIVDTKLDNAAEDFNNEQYENLDDDLNVDSEDADDYDVEDDYEDETYDEDNDDDIDGDDEYIDASHIKDEAPKGGIEDLLRALLDD